jgi:hypothetical protein
LKKLFITLFALSTLMAAVPVWAASPGVAGFKFLDIGTDARAEAMGGAQVAASRGVSAMYYNPAGMTASAPGEVLATYHNWVADIQSGFVGGVMRMGDAGRIGLAIQYLDYGDIPEATKDGTSLGNFGASDLAIAVGMARDLDERTAIGVTGRFIAESIDDKNATGLAFDAGVTHALPDGHTRVGLAVRNAGFQMKTFADGAKDDLPLTFVAGLSHELQGAPLLLTADAFKPRDDDFGGAFGLELNAFDPLLLRAGYNTQAGSLDSGSDSDKMAGFRFGAGFLLKTFVIDYAYGSMSKLGASHRFTIRTSVL